MISIKQTPIQRYFGQNKKNKFVFLLAFLLGVGSFFAVRNAVNPTPINNQPTPTPTEIILGCRINGVLPDKSCTPGATNNAVTQDNIQHTICMSGYTKTIRPSVSYTDQLKVKQISEYGYQDTNTKDYEEDHFIPLEVGGNPTDPHNLWPQSYYTSPNAHDKDKIENLCHQKVCSGQLTLQQAQDAITADWTTACQ